MVNYNEVQRENFRRFCILLKCYKGEPTHRKNTEVKIMYQLHFHL